MTTTQDAPAPEIGQSRRRKEDQRLITGRTRWTDNIVLPGMLHLAMVRSPFAHAKIVSIDTSAAAAATNVVAVLTGADFGAEMGVCINAWPITPDQVTPGHPPMPSDRVTFAGEIVAVVVARSAAEARDAAELVDVEYDELPAALDLKEAAADTVLAHPDLGTNKSALWVFDSAEAGTGGSADEAIAQARQDGIVIEREYRQQRLIPAFMEPRSVVVDPTGEQLTMWSATQIPHILRFALAATTGVPESKIRVIAPDVGGGFGGKLHVYPEEVVIPALAWRMRRAVRWVEDRREHFLASSHAREQRHVMEAALDEQGDIIAVRCDLVCDVGSGEILPPGVAPAFVSAGSVTGPYRFPRSQARLTCVVTNKTPSGAYRGFGTPEMVFALERLLERVARETGQDPVELRRRHLIRPEDLPYETPNGRQIDSGSHLAAFERAVDGRERLVAGGKDAAVRAGDARDHRAQGGLDVRVALGVPGGDTRVRLDGDAGGEVAEVVEIGVAELADAREVRDRDGGNVGLFVPELDHAPRHDREAGEGDHFGPDALENASPPALGRAKRESEDLDVLRFHRCEQNATAAARGQCGNADPRGPGRRTADSAGTG